MRRKFWMTIVTLVVTLSTPLGGAAAQPQAPAPVALVAQPASGPALHRSTGKLSYRLQALADSPQLQLASAETQARALSLPASGPGTLIKDQQGRILVDIRLSQVSDANLAALRNAGAQIVNVSPEYRVATGLIAASDLAGLGQLQALVYAMEEYAPLLASDTLQGSQPALSTVRSLAPAASACPVGTAVSEGDVQLKADLARTAYSVDGNGVKVGILSDSFDADATAPTSAADDVASGDLPGAANPCGFSTPVNVISETLEPGTATDEGRAMLQIVHDLAPAATLAFASAHSGEFAFAANIRALGTWGANVIADDVTYLDEPMFQEGPVSVAISDVVAAGAVYMTSAANSNLIIGGHDVASYEAPAYRPMAVPGFLSGQGEQSCHNFNPGAGTDNTYGITVVNNGGVQLDLQWAEPWYGVATELDVFVTDPTNAIVASSFFGGPGSPTPFQLVSWTNASGLTQTYNVEICRFVGNGYGTSTPRFKWVLLQTTNGVTAVQYPTSSGGDIVGPTIFGHSASLYSLSVAAARYNNNNSPEDFSSRGPATHYFGPVLNTTPAGAISPVVIHQPDFTATDGGCTTFFAQFDGSTPCWRFFGTSAAAPHAAAVAALLKEESITTTVTINQASAKLFLQQSARSMSGGTATVNSVGSGLIDALGAIAKEFLLNHHLFLPLVRK